MREGDPSETSVREGGGGESLSGAGTRDRRADWPQEKQQATDASPESKSPGRAEAEDDELAGRDHEPSESGEGERSKQLKWDFTCYSVLLIARAIELQANVRLSRVPSARYS